MKDSTNKNFWQRMAKVYAPFMKSSDALYHTISERSIPYLTDTANVLELACGSGQVTARLSGYTKSWIATDYSERMVFEAAKAVGQRSGLSFAVEDACRLSYPDGTFHAVMIANALHIMPEPARALAEIARVLKPGGILIAPTFIWSGKPQEWLRETLMQLVGFKVCHRWSGAEYSDFIRHNGFTILTESDLGGSLRPLRLIIAQKSEP